MKDEQSQSTSYLDFMMTQLAEDLRRQGELHVSLLKLLGVWPDPVEISVLVDRLNTTLQTTDLINLRGGEGANHPIIKQLPNGTLLTLVDATSESLVGQNEKWLRVRDPAGSEGYVNAGFVVWLGGHARPVIIDHLLNVIEFYQKEQLVEILPVKGNNQYLLHLNERGRYLTHFVAQQNS